MDMAQRDIDGGQAIIELHGFLAICQSLVDPLRIFVELVFQPVGFAELGKAEGKARIGFHRVFKGGDGKVEIARLVVSAGCSREP